MVEAVFEAILEVVLTPIIEPIAEWIDRKADKKTKKYSKRRRNMIKTIVAALFYGIFFCLFIVAISSYLQRAGLMDPKFSAAFVTVFLILNTIFLASAIPFSFRSKFKRQKYVVIPVSIIIFIFNVIFLIITW